jgi:hypothetical protein
MAWTPARPTVTLEKGVATFVSESFAWAVAIDLEGDELLSDNFFDLYPGIPHRIPWSGATAPKIVRLGNLDSGNLLRAAEGSAR